MIAAGAVTRGEEERERVAALPNLKGNERVPPFLLNFQMAGGRFRHRQGRRSRRCGPGWGCLSLGLSGVGPNFGGNHVVGEQPVVYADSGVVVHPDVVGGTNRQIPLPEKLGGVGIAVAGDISAHTDGGHSGYVLSAGHLARREDLEIDPGDVGAKRHGWREYECQDVSLFGCTVSHIGLVHIPASLTRCQVTGRLTFTQVHRLRGVAAGSLRGSHHLGGNCEQGEYHQAAHEDSKRTSQHVPHDTHLLSGVTAFSSIQPIRRLPGMGPLSMRIVCKECRFQIDIIMDGRERQWDFYPSRSSLGLRAACCARGGRRRLGWTGCLLWISLLC